MIRTLLKMVLVCLAFAQLGASAHAGTVPLRLTEQGRLFNKQSSTPQTGNVTMIFGIYDAATGGTPLFQEIFDVTLDEGYFSVQLGSTKPMAASLWDGSSKFIGVKVGNDAEMTPREEINSVPYAVASLDAIGDIHPASITIGGKKVVDGTGKWVGDSAGLAGSKGDPGTNGTNGTQGAKGDPGTNGTNGANGAPGILYSWDGFLDSAGRQDGGAVAHVTFSAPAAGYATVIASFAAEIVNTWSTPANVAAECTVGAQLSTTKGGTMPTSGPGLVKVRLLPNLVTIASGSGIAGDATWFPRTVSLTVPVLQGSNTVYLNGKKNLIGSGCDSTQWHNIQFTVLFSQTYAAATVTAN